MGTQGSIESKIEDYVISYGKANYFILYLDNHSLLKQDSEEKKGGFKIIKVKITENNIEEIEWTDPNLTIGWLLSEVTRRYNEYFIQLSK